MYYFELTAPNNNFIIVEGNNGPLLSHLCSKYLIKNLLAVYIGYLNVVVFCRKIEQFARQKFKYSHILYY